MTDVAVVTTTINVPRVLRQYADMAEKPMIIVAGDLNTPDEAAELVWAIGGRYLTPDSQKRWKCSDAIGWRSIQRRNVAILEAAKMGAEVIVTVDDDNFPVGDYYIWDHLQNLENEPTKWFSTSSGVYDPCSQLATVSGRPTRARGLPYDDKYSRTTMSAFRVRPEEELFVGVSAGLWLGDPDVDAVERMVNRPETTSMLRTCAVEPGTYAPINSQNTAWRRDLAPLMAVLPGVGRYDDIWGSYLACCVMEARRCGIVFGDPLVRQERNAHDLVKDIEAEVYGYRHTPEFIRRLQSHAKLRHDDASIEDQYSQAVGIVQDLLPQQTLGFVTMWLEDWTSL